jgi:hypothetical protein
MGTPARVVVLPKDTSVLRIEELVLPDPGPTQVVIKQFASGICHSQLHQMHRPRRVAGDSRPRIHRRGAEDRKRRQSRERRRHRAGDLGAAQRRAASAPPVRATLQVSDGGAVRERLHLGRSHAGRPAVRGEGRSGIRTDVTSIIGCAVMTGAGAVINTARVQPGQSVAIFGVGGVGLSAVVGARVAGANPIIAVDLDDAKLEFARRFGATHGINAGREDPVQAIHALTTRKDSTPSFRHR